MERNDIQGEARAPKSLADYLLKKGGMNIYGETNFRLVHASTRMTKKGGRWQDWDKSLTANERGGMITLDSGIVIPSHYKPHRIVIEVRNVRKYVFSVGWLVERWIPAAFYGSPMAWERRCVPMGPEPGAPLTNVPYGGSFPVHGDYEMCHHSPSDELPTITQLQEVLDRSERARSEALRADVEQIVLERINEAELDYHEQMRKESEEHEAMMRDMLSPMNSISLGAGRHRTMLAERAGIRAHVGN